MQDQGAEPPELQMVHQNSQDMRCSNTPCTGKPFHRHLDHRDTRGPKGLLMKIQHSAGGLSRKANMLPSCHTDGILQACWFHPLEVVKCRFACLLTLRTLDLRQLSCLDKLECTRTTSFLFYKTPFLPELELHRKIGQLLT